MRLYSETLTIVLLVASSMTFAQVTPEEHAAHHPGKQTSTSEVDKKADTDTGEKSINGAQADQAKMQALMDKIHQTKDPAERKRLLEQHRKMMHEEILTMRRMKCPMMGASGNPQASKAPPGTSMGSGQRGEGGQMMGEQAGAKGGDAMAGDMMKCHQMTQARIDMTTELLQQMLEHEEAER